jgi:uncharacterized protein (DUF305 family)
MSRQRTTLIVAAVIIVLAAGGAALAARSGDDRSAAAPQPSASTPPQRVIVPGRPGESASVTDSDKVKMPDHDVFNSIDTTFVQMMIVHHEQAIEMAKLAPGRAGNTQLKSFADRIIAAQTSEIAYLRGWLSQRKLPSSDPSHNHATMPGMQTPADMTTLAGLNGAAFDKKFVAMMSDHHRGAIQMATDVVRGGTDELLRETADEMAIEQGSEIQRMEQIGA